MFKSIRHGLFAALAGFTVLLCVGYTGLALVISYVTEDMLVDRLMAREAAAVTAHWNRTGTLAQPADALLRVHGDAATLPAPVREQVAAGRRRAEVFTDTGQHYHFRTLELPAPGRPRRVYLVADAGPLLVVSKLFQEVGGFLVAVAVGLIGLALLLAWLLARRLVSPLLTLAHEVRDASTGGPARFSAQGRPDEIGYLADRLAATIDELQATLRRESTFTRDVSHELRTPLTVLRNTLGQAAARPLDEQERAQLQAGLAEMGNTIDVLFALARAGHVGLEAFELRGCIEDSLLRLVAQGGRNDDWLALDMPDRIDVAGNPTLAALLLNNCLGNALFHGAPGAPLRVSYDGGELAIGNAVDPDRAGTTQGFHHGQNLLGRVAAAMGWQVRFEAGATHYQVVITPRLAG